MDLRARTTPGAEVNPSGQSSWRLTLPAGSEGEYRWAQLDDYLHRKRKDFLWRPPFRLKLRARVSHPDVAGTWGFGLWNDPFSFNLGLRGASRRLPALPNAAWFFFASLSNFLSLRNDLPANGFLASVFSSPLIPVPFLSLGMPVLPLLAFPRGARVLRGLASRIVREDAVELRVEGIAWHDYSLEWRSDAVLFWVDDERVFTTPVVPRGPMGLVLWVDNQFAAFPSDGRIRMGTLKTERKIELEIAELQIDGAS